MRDAKRVVPPEEHADNVGQRRPDSESGDEVVIRHPNDRENEREPDRKHPPWIRDEDYEEEIPATD